MKGMKVLHLVIDRCKQEYIETDITIKDLANKYGIPTRTLEGYSYRQCWGKLKQEYQFKEILERLDANE